MALQRDDKKMIAEQWEHIKELFESALDLPPEERPGFLSQLSQQAPAIADQVAELLASLENSGDFMLHPCCLDCDFLEDLEAEQQRFSPGDVLCGRFRIVSLIGRGGMGEVYKAWDEELEDHVALKTLRLEISTHELFTSRFRRELQLARKVTHPNVCRIFDSFKHSVGDGTFISVLSMELLQGQTLADYLKTKTQLTAAEALPIVQQIIAGLSAIHAAGIVHRDLKPSNLILVPASQQAKTNSVKTDAEKTGITNGPPAIDAPAGANAAEDHLIPSATPIDSLVSPPDLPQKQQTNISQAGASIVDGAATAEKATASASANFLIKITDFGIAGRLPDGLSQASQTEVSKLLGTPDYMAPEQLEHARANIQSDVYSLGLVLYEMVTGAKPFADASAWKRITAEPPPPRKLTPDLPENWDKTIACCLERIPAYRFQTAQEVLDGLEGTTSAVKMPPKPFWVRLKRSARNRRVAIAIFFLLAMSLSAGFYRYYPWKPNLPEGATVLFPEIENTTSDQELEAVTDLMRNQLGQSSKLLLLDRSEINKLSQQMGQQEPRAGNNNGQLAREMAWRARARLLLLGAISRVGNDYHLHIRVEVVPPKPDINARHWEKIFVAKNRDKVFESVQQACFWVRELVEQLPDSSLSQDPLPQSTTTSSWKALLLFSQAERLKSVGQTRQAIALLEESIQVDPDFSLACMRLGDLYTSLKDETHGFYYWDRALKSLQLRPVTQKEELRIRALFAQDSGDWKGSEEAFRTFETLYPHDYLPSFYLATTLARLNRTEEALAKSEEAEAKQPDSYFPVAQEARFNLVLGRIDQTKRAIERLRLMGRQGAADSIEVGLDILQNDFSGTLAALGRMKKSSDPLYKSKSYSLHAAFLSEVRSVPAAIRVLNEGIAFDEANGFTFNEADKWIALAYLHLTVNAPLSCRKAALRAIENENGRMHLLQAGTLLARAGFTKEATKMLLSLRSGPHIPVFEEATHQLRGEIFASEGRLDNAVQEMRKASEFDPPNNSHEYLARILVKAGNTKEAVMLYRYIVESPADVWQAPDYQYPGFWADMEETYASLQSNPGDQVAIKARARASRMKQFSLSLN